MINYEFYKEMLNKQYYVFTEFDQANLDEWYKVINRILDLIEKELENATNNSIP